MKIKNNRNIKMTDRVYIYPQSSCTCYNCTTNKKYESVKNTNGKPSNLSVRGCSVPSHFDCYNRKYVGTNTQPKDSQEMKINYINPQAYTQNYAKSFMAVDCKEPDACRQCPNPQYGSWDPRTWSATRNQYITFETPPLDGSIKLKDIYNDNLKGYGQNYQTYSDINAGQIVYYVDKSREDAYYRPLFNENVQVDTLVYKDPMDAMKPEYPRVTPYKNPITDESCNYGEYCLSFIKDTNMFREDILASNMVKINQQRWMPRWSDNKS